MTRLPTAQQIGQAAYRRTPQRARDVLRHLERPAKAAIGLTAVVYEKVPVPIRALVAGPGAVFVVFVGPAVLAASSRFLNGFYSEQHQAVQKSIT